MINRRKQAAYARSLQRATTAAEARAKLLSQLYRDGAEELRKLLMSESFFQRGRSRVLLKQIDEILNKLDVGTRNWVKKNIPELYERSSLMCVDAIRNQGIKGPLSTEFTRIHQDAVQAVADTVIHDMGFATKSMRKGVMQFIRKTQQTAVKDVEINREIAQGLIEGATRRQVSKRIADQLIEGTGQVPEGQLDEVMASAKKYMRQFGVKTEEDLKELSVAARDAWININGRHYNVEDYARLVARTKTREAVTIGTFNRLQENGLDLVLVAGGVYEDFCVEFRGRVFSISGTHDVYPAVADLPNGGTPFHPNCTDVMAPWVDHLRTEEERQAAADIDRSFLGMSAADTQRAWKQAA